MEENKVDLRILKTRKAIKEAFLTLVQTKGYDHITVQNIANEALINRNTFYLHYMDKPDLMEKLCQESIKKLNLDTCFFSLTEVDIHEVDKEAFTSVLRKMFRGIESDFDFFKIMLSQNQQPSFSSYLKEEILARQIDSMGEHPIDQRLRVKLEYMVSGFVGAICLWITESENLILEEFIEELSSLHFNNILELVKGL